MIVVSPARHEELASPVSRKSYARLPQILDVPNLIKVQLDSFRWLQEEGLKQLIDEVSPIQDFTGSRLEISFIGYEFREPRNSEQECRQRDLTYSSPLYIKTRLLIKATGEIKEQDLFFGDIPMITSKGTFITGGAERVVVSQLLRSPGVYLIAETDNTSGRRLCHAKKTGEEIAVDGGIKVLGALTDMESILKKNDIKEVYVALDLNNYAQILQTLKIVNKYAVNVRLIPDLFQLLTLKARVEDLDGFPVISIDEPPLRGMMLVIKRIADVVASILILILLSPFLLLVALVIKLTSRGPIFYHQERMGLDGMAFIMHKFRTMIYDAEKKTGPVMCSSDDPRITKFGRFLRKFSIDEWPQFFNVLKGDMSLVGPRPERPVFVKDFREKIPKYMLRHKVKSGLTGWAQVHGLRQDTDFDKRLEYDFYYIQNWSWLLDLKIIWLTLLKKGFIDKSV